jgi:hypothetical protein
MPAASLRFQREDKLAGLSPEQVLVAAEPIDREGRQRGEMQKSHCQRLIPGGAERT